jgi:hypothetical protein
MDKLKLAWYITLVGCNLAVEVAILIALIHIVVSSVWRRRE